MVLPRFVREPSLPARGKYRRQRQRRPLVGMLVHLDASTHEWIAAVPKQDLVVALDDADGRILYARFFPQKGTASTFAALESVGRNYGRFCELYTDRATMTVARNNMCSVSQSTDFLALAKHEPGWFGALMTSGSVSGASPSFDVRMIYRAVHVASQLSPTSQISGISSRAPLMATTCRARWVAAIRA